MTPEQKQKYVEVRDYLESHKLDAVLLSRRCNFSWFTCGARNYVGHACDVGNSSLLIRRTGEAVVITSNIEAPRLAFEDLVSHGIDIVQYDYYDAASREAVVKKVTGGLKIVADVPVAGVEAGPLPADFDQMRWILTASEIERYKIVCTETVNAVEYVCRDAQPGMTEYELAGMLSGAIRCSGAIPWVLLVASDERIEKFRHPLPTGKAIEKYFMLVVCAEMHGLICAASRLASFGTIPDELARKHQAVANVDAAMIAATVPGATLGDVFAVAQEAYVANGFADQWKHHHQGGPCGYQPREAIATPGDRTPILSGQAFAWNPSITGTKSEDTIICRKSGTQLLADPTGWPMIEGTHKGKTLPRPAILIK
jgi:antitoxin VapB